MKAPASGMAAVVCLASVLTAAAAPAAGTAGQPQLPAQEAEQGLWAVEPLLRPGAQRRGPPVGQRRGGVRGRPHRAADRLPVPGIGGLAHRLPEPPPPRAAVTRYRTGPAPPG